MLADQPHEGSFTGEYPRWGPACGAGMECPLTRREKLPEMRQKNLQSSKKPLPGIPTGAKSLDSERLRTGRQ